ncbi:MAG: RHS repeat protein, partial [Endozoicomonadaceae bacterium]|nr:RHS repeat protein [Endozoicomonadaceae bacterium]
QNINDTLSYGLLKQTILTGRVNGDTLLTSLINNYYYIKSDDGYRKTSYNTTTLSYKKLQFSSAVTISLFTNQLLKSVEPGGRNIKLYHYDTWGRLIQTDFAVGTPFATSRHYQYSVSDTLNQVIITAPTGLKNKIIFDGAGRTLMNFDEALTADGKPSPNHWWLRQSAAYNQYGEISSYKVYQFDSTGKPYTLTAIPEHDYSGRVTSVRLSNGETDFIRYDDAYRCVINYQRNAQGEYSPLSVSRYNILNKPVKYWVLPSPNRHLPNIKTLCLQSDKQTNKVSFIVYDGFGRAVLQDSSGRVTRQCYNALGQITDTVNPAGNRTHKTYDLAGHITAIQFFGVSGAHYLLSSAHYNAAGQLIWSSQAERGKTFYHYTSEGIPDLIKTPEGHRISWRYNVLNLPLTEFIDGKQHWSVNYDFVSTLPTQKTDITGTTFYHYSADGMIRSLSHKGKGSYPDYKLQWKYNKNRRIVSVTDISGNVTNTIYDEQGRVKKTIYHAFNGGNKILSSVHYDSFSRIKTIYYGSGMQRHILYDTYGHQSDVTDTLRDQLISQWNFSYDRYNNIVTLYQKKGNSQYGIFNYKYDDLNNLVTMTCNGSSGLPLCPRDTVFYGSGLTQVPVITRQRYTFTLLNQLKSVVENLQDPQQKTTVSKVTAYEYSNSVTPLRIQHISTSWNQSTPIIRHLIYDAAGNVTVDVEK